jgi:enamine deaminase RidA (YjgF/YER057c/UK114 family)
MKKRRIVSPEVAEPPERTWSNCLVVGNQVFIAGLVARGASFDADIETTDAYEQTVAVFAKMKHLMEEAGGCIDDVVKLLIYLTDMNDRDAVWKARREVFSGDYPVSTLIEISKLARPKLKVEIEAIGILGASGEPPPD